MPDWKDLQNDYMGVTGLMAGFKPTSSSIFKPVGGSVTTVDNGTLERALKAGYSQSDFNTFLAKNPGIKATGTGFAVTGSGIVQDNHTRDFTQRESEKPTYGYILPPAAAAPPPEPKPTPPPQSQRAASLSPTVEQRTQAANVPDPSKYALPMEGDGLPSSGGDWSDDYDTGSFLSDYLGAGYEDREFRADTTPSLFDDFMEANAADTQAYGDMYKFHSASDRELARATGTSQRMAGSRMGLGIVA